jgi:signal transduction histidine kinase
MNQGIIFRLIIFVSMIALLVALIGWIALTSWRRTGELHEQFSAKQYESFLIAARIQETILGLNNLMLHYAADRDDADWSGFSKKSQDFGFWLKQQQPLLSSQTERLVLSYINNAFTNYLAAAAAINIKLYGASQSKTRVVEFTDLEKQSKTILDLGIQLSQAHQRSLDSFQSQSIHSLNFLRVELLGSLAILVFAGVWLAVIVYREMLTPLRVQLVESRQLVEQHEKLASLGMLAAGVAHEIRNPLTSIKAWLYLQQKHLAPGTPEYSDAEVIGGEINRLERIVRDFLQFARPSEPKYAVLPADQPLRDVQTLLQPGLEKSGIKLIVAEVANAQIRIDPQQIKQVLINLVQNAADSIRANGTITLRAVADEKRLADRQLDVVILEVSDTGAGISEDAQKRLFDPFFTTKDTGTGLGLPIAARIVEKHGGALQYQNHAEHGATFGIILPRHNHS